jgi:Arc/MetJ family transcription regulator
VRTSIVLNDQLVEEAMRLTNITNKRHLLELALRELVASRQRPDLRDLFGTDLIAPDYDYKAARAGRSVVDE